MKYILALDEGTTSARAIVFNAAGEIVALAQQEFEQIFPQAGWVEHNPEEIWTAQHKVALAALAQAKLTARDIAAIGITNQRETAILWDRATGQPIHNAIVWQDRRTAPWCDALAAAGHTELIRERTGLVIDAYFSGSKVAWLLEHVPGARAKAERGELAFGTLDAWLVWKLTGGRLHATDATNAARTMLLNLRTGQWDDELLALLKIPRGILPEVAASSQVLAEASVEGLAGIPIAGIAGDQQSALFGQLCLAPGQTKNTYGTGCFMLQTIGKTPTPSQNRLLTTIAWRLGDELTYALEGSVFIGGAVVQWLRDGLGIIQSSQDVEALARSVPDSGGIYVVPAFAGLGAPHWDPYARGTILGITRGTTAAHIARAALESVAFQVADLIDAMNSDSGKPLPELRVDGGAAANDLLMQFQADLLGVPVLRPAITETTALGAAYLAGLAVGYWQSSEELARQWRVERRFEPELTRKRAAELRTRWQGALERSKGWEPA